MVDPAWGVHVRDFDSDVCRCCYVVLAFPGRDNELGFLGNLGSNHHYHSRRRNNFLHHNLCPRSNHFVARCYDFLERCHLVLARYMTVTCTVSGTYTIHAPTQSAKSHNGKPVKTVTVTVTQSAAQPTATTKTITSIFTAPATTATITQTVTLTAPAAVPTASLPAPEWQCDGSGKDGKTTDHTGAACPYGNIGFFWFGTSWGWQPPASFSPAATWSPPIEWGSTCSLSLGWWSPPAVWVVPFWFPAPSAWRVSLTPHDHTGASRPSPFPEGFLWYGSAYGWQPCSTFTVPSIGWIVPTTWKAEHSKWWSPRTTLTLRNNYACPTWWSRTHLSGSWTWASSSN
ncbi:hypothetical protein RQP46_003328 [Phenoliferia psychrophenolica]